VRVVRPTGSC